MSIRNNIDTNVLSRYKSDKLSFCLNYLMWSLLSRYTHVCICSFVFCPTDADDCINSTCVARGDRCHDYYRHHTCTDSQKTTGSLPLLESCLVFSMLTLLSSKLFICTILGKYLDIYIINATNDTLLLLIIISIKCVQCATIFTISY